MNRGRPDMPALYGRIKERLECIHYIGDLRRENLKLIYDGRSIAERYRAGDLWIHMHGFSSADTGREAMKVRFCGVSGYDVHPDAARGRDVNEFSMFVLFGKSLQVAEPLPSVIRLRPLDQCNVLDIKTFEIGLSPGFEVIWRLTDRKLESALRWRWMPFAQFKDRVNHLIQDGPKQPCNHPDINANFRNGIGKFISDSAVGLWLSDNKIGIALTTPQSIDLSSQIRQLFPSPF